MKQYNDCNDCKCTVMKQYISLWRSFISLLLLARFYQHIIGSCYISLTIITEIMWNDIQITAYQVLLTYHHYRKYIWKILEAYGVVCSTTGIRFVLHAAFVISASGCSKQLIVFFCLCLHSQCFRFFLLLFGTADVECLCRGFCIPWRQLSRLVAAC